jgi:hypothetical protein
MAAATGIVALGDQGDINLAHVRRVLPGGGIDPADNLPREAQFVYANNTSADPQVETITGELAKQYWRWRREHVLNLDTFVPRSK